MCVESDRLTRAGLEKAVWPCTRTALIEKIYIYIYCETKFAKTMILILNKPVFRINIEEKNSNAIQISPAVFESNQNASSCRLIKFYVYN